MSCVCVGGLSLEVRSFHHVFFFSAPSSPYQHAPQLITTLPSVCEDATAPSLFQAFSCRCVEWGPRGHRFLIPNCQIIQSKTQRTIVHIVFSVVVVPLIVLSFLSPISSPPLHGVSFILAFCASWFHLPLGKFHFF